jgi:Uma2 family endonuclease
MPESLMTAEELLQLDLPGKSTELIRGRLVVREPAGRRHGAVTFELSLRIGNWVNAHDLGRVYSAETGFQIESAPDTVRAPDIAFVRKELVPEVEPLGYAPGAPDLAVETVRGDHPGYTLAKVAQWLEAGVRLIWLIDCVRHTARVYRADGTETLLGENGVLGGEDVLPGFQFPLGDLW